MGVGEDALPAENTGATRQVANMQAQGIGVGVEGTPKIAQQAAQAVENIENTRARILQDNPNAGQGTAQSPESLGQAVGSQLRRRNPYPGLDLGIAVGEFRLEPGLPGCELHGHLLGAITGGAGTCLGEDA